MGFPHWQDEGHFWITSLIFSKGIPASFDQLYRYQQLNTPLPFVIYGLLEYLLHGGIVVGRALNFILSMGITTIIGWPDRERGVRALLSAAGLMMCPYFLWLSGHLYTDIMAAFFVLLGVYFYTHERHLWSCIAFVLAIASRQYMLAFPVAVLVFEVSRFWDKEHLTEGVKKHWGWIAQFIAAGSIFGWFLLFKGMAPEAAINSGRAPSVQQTLMSLTPNTGLYSLSVIGLYFVVPEFLLFRKQVKAQMSFSWKTGLGALALLIIFLVCPPPSDWHTPIGFLQRMSEAIPDYFRFGLFYLLALLTCVRFSRLNLGFWMVLFNALMMMKAHSWDRYTLPLLVALWYLKSKGALDWESSGQLEPSNRKPLGFSNT